MDIGVFLVGVGVLVVGVLTALKLDAVRSSEEARVGFGLGEWMTGEGMSDSRSASISASAAPKFDSEDETGKPVMRETITIMGGR